MEFLSHNKSLLGGIYLQKDFLRPDVFKEFCNKDVKLFTRTGDELYPGLSLIPSLTEKEIFHQAVAQLIGISFKRCHVRFRYVTEESFVDDKSLIHSDQNCFVGVLFLKVNCPKCWGPRFYEHVKTGRREQSFEPGSRQALIDDIVVRNHHKNLSEWKVYREIDVEENFFVLFDGHLYHSGPQMIDSSQIKGDRLTLEIFIKRDDLLELMK